MIVDKNISEYLHSLLTDGSDYLEDYRKDAESLGVPIIRRETESFLNLFLNTAMPKSILEIGSGVAYSAIAMAHCCESIEKLDTIENYQPRIEKAKENLEKFQADHPDKAKKINLIEGDACDVIKELGAKYDLIFLDGPKAQYPDMLPVLLSLLNERGILIADNVLLEGDTAKSRYAVERRDRTVHERMRAFLKMVTSDESLITTVQAIGDGLSVSIKK